MTYFISWIKAQAGICCLSTRTLGSDHCKIYLHCKKRQSMSPASLLLQGLRPTLTPSHGRTSPSIASGGANPRAEQSQQGITLCYPTRGNCAQILHVSDMARPCQLDGGEQIHVQLACTYGQLRTTSTNSDCKGTAEIQVTVSCMMRGSFRFR